MMTRRINQIEYLKQNILFKLGCIERSISKISKNIQKIKDTFIKEGVKQTKDEDFPLEEIKIELR